MMRTKTTFTKIETNLTMQYMRLRGGEDDGVVSLGCDSVLTCRQIPTFQKNVPSCT